MRAALQLVRHALVRLPTRNCQNFAVLQETERTVLSGSRSGMPETAHCAQLVAFMLTQMDAGKDITVTTYRKDNPDGSAARTFYKRLGFSEGSLTEKFGHPAQEFILKRQPTEQA